MGDAWAYVHEQAVALNLRRERFNLPSDLAVLHKQRLQVWRGYLERTLGSVRE